LYFKTRGSLVFKEDIMMRLLKRQSIVSFVVSCLLLLLISSSSIEARTTRNYDKYDEDAEKKGVERNSEQEGEREKEVTIQLPLQDVNFLILTDLHSSVNGRGGNNHNNDDDSEDDDHDVDFGDILSFYQRLKENLDDTEQDLWFVMNGGFVHGSILGRDPPTALIGTLEHMPYDLVTLGSDEVESSETVELLKQPGGLIDWWGPNLITSNILVNSTKKSLGHQYKYLRGKAATILSFGFLLDDDLITMSDLLIHERIEKTLEEPWFRDVLEGDEFDMVLVMTQTDNNSSLLQTILRRIRNIVGKRMPVQFVTGRTGIRAANTVGNDAHAYSIEAGGYLDTLGFVSIDLKGKNLFNHEFIDTNKKTFGVTLDRMEYMTPDGTELGKYIHRTIEAAGGNEIIGCSFRRYHAADPLTYDGSLLRLYLNDIVSKGLLQHLDSSSPKEEVDKKEDENIVEKVGDVVNGVVEKTEEVVTGAVEKVKEMIGTEDNDEEEKKEKQNEKQKEQNNNPNHHNILLQRIEGFVKYDIFQGVITMNDVYVTVPRDDTIQKVAYNVKGKTIKSLKEHLSSNKKFLDNTASIYAYNTDIELEPEELYELYAPTREVPKLLDYLKEHNDDATVIISSIDDDNNELVKDETNGHPITLRQIWIDYIKKEWTYDNKECVTESSSQTKSSSSSSVAHITPNEHKEEKEEELNTSSSSSSSRNKVEDKEEKKKEEGHFPWFLLALGCLVLVVRQYKDQLPPIPGLTDNNLSYNQPYGGNNVFGAIQSKFKDNNITMPTAQHSYVPSVNNFQSSSYTTTSYQDHQQQQQQQHQVHFEDNDGLHGSQIRV